MDRDAHEQVEHIHHGEEVGIGGRRRRGKGEGGTSRLEMRRQEWREHGGMRVRTSFALSSDCILTLFSYL